jgi:hypothetical protein
MKGSLFLMLVVVASIATHLGHAAFTATAATSASDVKKAEFVLQASRR